MHHPSRHHQVDQPDQMIAVMAGDESRREILDIYIDLRQPPESVSTHVELQQHNIVTNQHTGAGDPGVLGWEHPCL
ncbi:MAG: hypothetical protein GY926_20255 [bacterium]|nr:hypothetical protein [bacterium]